MKTPRLTSSLLVVTFESGDVADVLFCRPTDTKALEGVFAEAPLGKAGEASAFIRP